MPRVSDGIKASNRRAEMEYRAVVTDVFLQLERVLTNALITIPERDLLALKNEAFNNACRNHATALNAEWAIEQACFTDRITDEPEDTDPFADQPE